MSDAHAMLRRLQQLGFRVERVADDVRVRGPADRLPPETIDYLKRHKPLFLVALTCPVCGRSLDAREPECWWGDRRVHRDCGERAWRKAWKTS